MKLKVEVKLKMILYNKNNMEPLIVENTINKEWEEGTEEFKELYENVKILGKERKGTQKEIDEYDRMLLNIIASGAKENILASTERVIDVIRKCFTGRYDGYVEYAGYVINPKDFCACKVMPPETHIEKV